MNKKIVLSLFLALAAGMLAGQGGKYLFNSSTASDSKPPEPRAFTPPRFGDPLPGTSPASFRRDIVHSGSAKGVNPNESLSRYLRMGTEELLAELENIGKQGVCGAYTDSLKQDILLNYFCARLGEDSPQQTLAFLKDRKELQCYMEDILDVWGQKNPEAAMAYCRERLEEGDGNKSLWRGKYIKLLSARSPEEALDYLRTCSPEEVSEEMRYPLLRLAKKTPEKLPEILEKLKPAMKRGAGVDRSIALLLAQSDWSAAEQWIGTMPEGHRAETLGAAVCALPTEEAREKLKTLDEAAKIHALSELGVIISFEESSAKALEFVRNNATEEQAAKIFEQSYYSFKRQDAELNAYLENMPSGAVKDGILKQALRAFDDSDISFFDGKMEEAFVLIDQLSSAGKKEKATDNLLDNWRYEDPQAAKSWVEQSSLAEDKKKEFIRQCDDDLKPSQDGK